MNDLAISLCSIRPSNEDIIKVDILPWFTTLGASILVMPLSSDLALQQRYSHQYIRFEVQGTFSTQLPNPCHSAPISYFIWSEGSLIVLVKCRVMALR
jgi:hypothetical protein